MSEMLHADDLLREVENLTDHIPSESLSARSDLYVGRTVLQSEGKRLDFFGLFVTGTFILESS